ADTARSEDVQWLTGINLSEVRQFAETSQAAHLLMRDHHTPPTEQDLQSCLQAAQLYSQIGLTNRVQEVTQPLVQFANGLRADDPAQAAQRANLFLVLAQVYSSAGMDTDLHAALDGVMQLDGPNAAPELHQTAQLARAMIELQQGHLQAANAILLQMPENPMA